MFNWNQWNHIFFRGGMKNGKVADLTWKVMDVGGYAQKFETGIIGKMVIPLGTINNQPHIHLIYIYSGYSIGYSISPFQGLLGGLNS